MKFNFSEFYCTECGKKGLSIPRQLNRRRENGHLKKMYCFFCQDERNFAEIKPNSKYDLNDFKLEFMLGRFVDGNRIAINDLKSCGSIHCYYNKDGKCWNAKMKGKCIYENN